MYVRPEHPGSAPVHSASTMSAPKFLLAVVASIAFASTLAAPQPQPQRPQSAGETIAIVSLNSDISPDGTFSYNYETANGIVAEARGSQKDPETQSVQGSFSFTAPDDGQKYSVSYTADEGGFVATGDHLPTSPPIPEAIQRSLEFNAKNPEPEDGPPAPAQRG